MIFKTKLSSTSKFGLFLALSLLIGCTVGPRYTQPEMDIPCEWHTNTSGFSECCQESICWWKTFNDPVLEKLIERASENNIDLHLAATRVLQARRESKSADANFFPRADLSATFGHAQYNRKVLNKLLSSCCNDQKSKTKNSNLFEIGFDVEWEIDLFGANAHERKAAKATVEGIQESYGSVWITLSAEVARNYIELRTLQTHLSVLDKHIANQNESVTLIDGLLETGFVGSIDQIQAGQQLNEFNAQRPAIQLSITKSIHRISLLLGTNPGDLFCELEIAQELPEIPCQNPISLPSELLRRRPDIRKAERDLAAATEHVGTAVANLFPRLSLVGFVGDVSTNPNLPGYASFAGAQLLQPLFNSRLLNQDVEFNKTKVQEALYGYQKTVLDALEESENAIASYQFDLEKFTRLLEAQNASEQVSSNMTDLYERGFKDYLEVLISNRAMLNAEEATVDAQAALLMDYIFLYKAMGGDWVKD